jgi:hypothetical protein
VKEAVHNGRACITYPTALGVDRLKFLDGAKPKYLWAESGKGKAHLYGKGAAREHGGPVLFLVNGEPSVWACDQEGVAAVCLCGEGVTPNESLIQELKASGFTRFKVVYDLDQAGRRGALATVMALKDAGLDAVALELPKELGLHGDCDDLHRREGKNLSKALEALPELSEHRPLGVLLKDVKPQKVQWLWRGWIPAGKITMLDGDPGLGKTTLALDIAARLSRGHALPDGAPCDAGGAVILTAEDDAADTILPRLQAAGADLGKILYLDSIPDENGNDGPVSIPENLSEIERAMARVNARLLIVDPIMAFFSGKVDSHRDQDVRRALAPLKKLAGRTGAAVLCVRHLNKVTGGKAIYRGGGSIGIGGAARSVALVHEDPNDPERRVLASVKSNLGRPPQSLSFGIETAELPETGETSKIAWHGYSDLTAESLLAAPVDAEERDGQAQAEDFLRELLADGPLPAKQIWQAAEGAGVSRYAIKTAKVRLKIVVTREGGLGRDGAWIWSLPDEDENDDLAKKSKIPPKKSKKEDFDFLGETQRPSPLQADIPPKKSKVESFDLLAEKNDFLAKAPVAAYDILADPSGDPELKKWLKAHPEAMA